MQYFGFDRPSFGIKTFGFGSSEFSPLDLFAGGKQGAWYDPSDKTTLFQDVAGTVPVTKDGDPVGLMLDKSQGLKLSPNILPNSDFSDGLTGWRVGFPDAVSATMVNGKCILEHIGSIRGAAIGLEPTLNFEVGKSYKIIVDVEDAGGSAFDMGIYNFQDATQATLKVIGRDTLEIIFTAKSSSIKFRFGFDVNSPTAPIGSKLIIHSIKAQELSGNHATQTVSTARPIYRTDGVLSWFDTDGVDDTLAIPLQVNNIEKSISLVIAVKTNENASYSAYIGGGQNGRGVNILEFNDGKVHVTCNSTLSHRTAPLITKKQQYGKEIVGVTFNITTDSFTARLNGEVGGSLQLGGARINPPSDYALFSGGLDSRFAVCSFYGLVLLQGETTAAQNIAIDEYLATKAGVTL